MLEITLILILVVVAMVAIIVNRKSLLACIFITVSAALLGSGFLALYANADQFGSYEKLLRFTITCSVIIILALLAVTYIGVKMHFKNFKNLKKTGTAAPTATAPVGEPRLIPGTNVMAKAVGIFGRQPIERATTPTPVTTAPAATVRPKPTPVVTATPGTPIAKVTPSVPTQAPAAPKTTPSADAMLKRMLDKGTAFKSAGQFVLAEQMYVTYIARCTDNISRADGELLMLDCRIQAGNLAGAKEQLADLLGKLRSGEYALTQEQKKMLAECKINLMKLQ